MALVGVVAYSMYLEISGRRINANLGQKSLADYRTSCDFYHSTYLSVIQSKTIQGQGELLSSYTSTQVATHK